MSVHTFSALGTSWWIEIFDELDTEQLNTIFSDVELFVINFENRYSRFKGDSLISVLNQKRQLVEPDVDLVKILEAGLTLYSRSGGLFNLLLGETLLARGYDADYTLSAKIEPVKIFSPIEHLHIAPRIISLTAGLIDLGGYGKGYLTDLLAARLQTKHNIAEFLINGGGDIFGTSEHGEPIVIYLEDPLTPGSYLGTTTIFKQGFAASSPHKRAWVSSGHTHTHIVNSQLEPVMPLCDATFIVADTACTADAFATVALFASEVGFAHLAKTEHLGYARYTVSTRQLAANVAFKLTPLP